MQPLTIIDPAASPTPVLATWSTDWKDLPLGPDVVRVDGPGTRGAAHDEYAWLPKIESDTFRCFFDLELAMDPQPGHPVDVGRHGGVGLGVSKAYPSGDWGVAPRRTMTDGVWIGWWPVDNNPQGPRKLGGRAFGSTITFSPAPPQLSEGPQPWAIRAEPERLVVSISSCTVCEIDLPQPLSGFMCFWRARSGHAVTVHNLRVEQPGQLLLTLQVSEVQQEGLMVACTSLGGESLATVQVQHQETLRTLRSKVLAVLGEPYAKLRLLSPTGEVLDSELGAAVADALQLA